MIDYKEFMTILTSNNKGKVTVTVTVRLSS